MYARTNRDRRTRLATNVDRLLEDSLIDPLELAQGEAQRHEAVGDIRVIELAPKPLPGVVEHALVRERQLAELAQRPPSRAPLQVAPEASLRRGEQGEIRDDDLGVAITGGVEGVELLEEYIRETGLILQLAAGGAFERFPRLQEPSGECPLASVWLSRALDEKDREALVEHGEDGDDDRGGHGCSVLTQTPWRCRQRPGTHETWIASPAGRLGRGAVRPYNAYGGVA